MAPWTCAWTRRRDRRPPSGSIPPTSARLADVLRSLGEERFARRIARAVVEARRAEPLQTTRALADVVSRAVPVHERTKHPATRSFQAIRVYINQELEQLREALEQVIPTLKIGGRLVVISFHSLEDRIVKRFIRTTNADPASIASKPS